nr:nitrogenase component 1 [uncultured Desulfobacter sp.]
MTTSKLNKEIPSYTPTQNACKMCTPLGATLVFQGIEGCVPLLHGSQGCSTPGPGGISHP